MFKTLTTVLFALLISTAGLLGQESGNDSIRLSQESAMKMKEDIQLLNYNLGKLINVNDSLREFNQKLIDNNYSLNNQLKAEKFEGKLFEGVLNEQTYRFLFLVLLLTVLGTSISIYAVRDKGKQLEDRFGSAITEINKAFSKNLVKQSGLERELYSSLGNVNYNIARQYANEGEFLAALSYVLASSMYIYKTVIDDEGKIADGTSATLIRIMSILTTADHYLESVPRNDKGIERFRALFPDMLIALEDMTKSDEGSINGRASEIKRKLIELEQL